MGCQHRGLLGQQGGHASPPSLLSGLLLYRSNRPAADVSNSFPSGCHLLHTEETQPRTHTPRSLPVSVCVKHTHFYLQQPSLLVPCLAWRNLSRKRQSIFRAQPCSTSSTGLRCKRCSSALIYSPFPFPLCLSLKPSLLFPPPLALTFLFHPAAVTLTTWSITKRVSGENGCDAEGVGDADRGNTQHRCRDCSGGGQGARLRAVASPHSVHAPRRRGYKSDYFPM